MKRVLLVIGCFLMPVGLIALFIVGSVKALELQEGDACRDCGPLIHVGLGETAVIEGGGPAVNLSKTVGLDSTICAATNQITLMAGGGTVYYCYFIENIGDVTMTMHTVVDDKLGTLLGPGFPFSLAPGATAWFSVEVNITQTVVNSATWKAFNPGPVDIVTGTDTALVIIEGPITALTATNDSPTAVGRETTLSAMISGGGNETYTWDFGDGDFGSGAATTHIYPAIGVYTAVVTATNSFNSLTATTIVTVTEPPVYLPAVFRP